MSGAVEGVEAHARELAHRIIMEFRPNGWEAKENELYRLLLGSFEHLTTPPARSYADGVSGEALFRAFMASDVTRLTTTALPEEWPHMMPSYRAAWDDLAIRLLSQGGNA